jgi:hypothetical protein
MQDPNWNVGTMGYWNIGFKGKIPYLNQYSNAPALHF